MGATAWGRLLRRVRTFRENGFRCTYCGKDLLADGDAVPLATIDHVHPLAGGGTDGQSNRVAACCTCNWLKRGTPVGSI